MTGNLPQGKWSKRQQGEKACLLWTGLQSFTPLHPIILFIRIITKSNPHSGREVRLCLLKEYQGILCVLLEITADGLWNMGPPFCPVLLCTELGYLLHCYFTALCTWWDRDKISEWITTIKDKEMKKLFIDQRSRWSSIQSLARKGRVLWLGLFFSAKPVS